MTTPWLHIIGVTEAGVSALSPDHLALVESAETIIGSERMLPASTGTQNIMAWQSPLDAMIAQVKSCAGSSTVILATGDPNWFGIGATLSRHFNSAEFVMHPAPSAFQLAAARLHWPLQNVMTISLHGRDVANLHPHLQPGARILALTSDKTTLSDIIPMLSARGYGETQLTVLENLGATSEQISRFTARDGHKQTIDDFYVLALDCVADPSAELLSAVPGLPDSAFISDGQLTKREVRATSLAKLSPYPSALLWDVGAGCGAIGIEWMRAAKDTKAIGFECDLQRVEMIAKNARALGVPSLQIVAGDALDNITNQPPPDAIFLGGAVANEKLFAACWQALKPGGRMVTNAVTIEGETALYQRHEELGGEIARIEIAQLDHIGGYRALRPRMAVTQWLVTKGRDT